MTGKPSGSTALKVLRAELRSDSAAVQRLAREATVTFFAKSSPRPNETLYATALLLHHFYSALESAFERIAKMLDGDVPTGIDWHRQLLQRMTIDVDEVRPAVLSSATVSDLDEYRRFRHVVRHAYESPLQEERLERLVHKLGAVVEGLEADVESFMLFLDGLIADT